MGLNTGGGADYQNGAIQNRHSPLGFCGKIHVAGGVQQGQLPCGGGEASLLGENGDASLPFQGMGIQISIRMIHPTQCTAGAADIQQCLRERGLSGIHMSQQTRTTRYLLRLFRHGTTPLSWIISTIIPWKMAFVDRKTDVFIKSVVLLSLINMVLPAY